MNRRDFFARTLSGLCVSGLASRPLLAGQRQAVAGFLLSENGCGRATGYAEANKIVTWNDKTHMAWLDSVAEGFRVRIRTLDHGSGQWSPTYTLGAAHDNHGGPALTVDSQGYLHAIYFPHHHPFRYRKSKAPNDASQWREEIQFGERCTYPTLVCGADDTLYLTCRRSFSQKPWQIELWKKPPGAGWEGPAVVAQARFTGYAHFQESLAWGPDHKRLHLCCRFHENTDRHVYGRIQTVGYMFSDDFGVTWRRSDETAIKLPATAETIEVLAAGGAEGRALRAGAIGVDPKGRPHVIYSVHEDGHGETILATPNDGSWLRRELSPELPPPWSDWDLGMPGGLTFNARGELFVTGTIQRTSSGETTWGHPKNEVVRFCSSNGGQTFAFRLASRPDPSVSHWLPNIEKPTGHNTIPADPGIIYTAGPPGEKNTDILSNGVHWAPPEQLS